MAKLPKSTSVDALDTRPLTGREQDFAHFLATMSPADAAQKAGYADPDEYKRLMARPALVVALLAELQRREVKLAVLRVQAKGTLSGVMTCPLDKANGGPNWSDRVAAAKTVLDLLSKEGKTLAEVSENEDLAQETSDLAKNVLATGMKDS